MDAQNPTRPGLCECGCGRETSVIKLTDNKRGRRKGERCRFIVGHAARSSGIDYAVEDRGYETPCWIWQLSKNKQGYGNCMQDRSISSLAHVVYWVRANGPVPEGLELDHLCRVRACCNPEHLEPVTHVVNAHRGAKMRLTEDQVRMVRDRNQSPLALAKEWGVSVNTLYQARYRRTWKAFD